MNKERGRIRAMRRVLDSGVVFYAMYEVPGGGFRKAGQVAVITSENAARQRALQMAHDAGVKAWNEGFVDPRNVKQTLADYAERIWAPSLTVEVKTKQNYLSTYECHIKPVFGQRPMRSILKSEVSTWLADLQRLGKGPSTRRMALLVLGMIFRLAKDDLGIKDPTEGVDRPKVPAREVTIFTYDQWDKFFAALPEYWKPLCYVGVWTGLRPEELRALAPCHVNWKAKQIRVSEAIVQVSGKHNDGETMHRKDTKSHKERYVDFDHPTLQAKVGQVLAKEIMARGLTKDSSDPIWLLDGKPFRQEYLQDVFDRTCQVAGIPRRTPKDMRSTRASWLLKACGDVMYVKAQLGHRDVQTTMKYLTVVDRQEHDDDTSFEDFLAEEN